MPMNRADLRDVSFAVLPMFTISRREEKRLSPIIFLLSPHFLPSLPKQL